MKRGFPLKRFKNLAVALIAVIALACFAATAKADVHGYVVGPGCCPGAIVHIHNTKTGANGSTSTNSSGFYYIGGTTANTVYTLYATANGRKSNTVGCGTGSSNTCAAATMSL